MKAASGSAIGERAGQGRSHTTAPSVPPPDTHIMDAGWLSSQKAAV